MYLNGLGDVNAGPAPVATLAYLPNGTAGTRETLRIMRGYARAAVRSPDQFIRHTALNIIQNIAPRNWTGEVKAIHAYVRDNIRYVQDPDGIELVQTPEKTLELGAGDCDDKSTLLAALLIATGHPAQFVAVGMNGESFSHVLVETVIGDAWVPLETILPVQVGWYPAGVTSRYILKV